LRCGSWVGGRLRHGSSAPGRSWGQKLERSNFCHSRLPVFRALAKYSLAERGASAEVGERGGSWHRLALCATRGRAPARPEPARAVMPGGSTGPRERSSSVSRSDSALKAYRAPPMDRMARGLWASRPGAPRGGSRAALAACRLFFQRCRAAEGPWRCPERVALGEPSRRGGPWRVRPGCRRGGRPTGKAPWRSPAQCRLGRGAVPNRQGALAIPGPCHLGRGGSWGLQGSPWRGFVASPGAWPSSIGGTPPGGGVTD
jgi:hypothetical protein